MSVGSKGNERQITNVADGTEDTDAANVRQVKNAENEAINTSNNYTDSKISQNNTVINQNIDNAKNEAINTSNNYTDEKINQINNTYNQKFEQLGDKINRAEKRLNAGIAGVTAIASIPYVAEDNFSYGIGIGNYQNGNATAAGVQYKLSQNTNVRLNVSWDSSHNTALGVGFAGGW
ncbi:YadA-like family protein [Pantoea stewartii]|uniref:YadA-like family protein n=1 Tax=Pantoea stewartii TaxID=66269 RepID=UPI003DA6F083